MKLKITLATLFTLARIIIVPFLMIAIVRQEWLLACILLVSAALSDMFDGLCARWMQEETDFGAALDPLADKFLVITSYCSFMYAESSFLFEIPGWFMGLVLVREMVIMLGALYLGIIRGYVAMRPTMLGKLTTVVQLLFIGTLLFMSYLHMQGGYLIDIAFVVAWVCVVASLVHYVILGFQGFWGCYIKNT